MKRLRSEASSGAQERRPSLATEAISSQRSAISAFNRISSRTEGLKRFMSYVSHFTRGKLRQPPTAFGNRRALGVWLISYGIDNQPQALIFVVLVLDAPVLWEIGFPDGVNLVEEVRLGRFRVGPCGS